MTLIFSAFIGPSIFSYEISSTLSNMCQISLTQKSSVLLQVKVCLFVVWTYNSHKYKKFIGVEVSAGAVPII